MKNLIFILTAIFCFNLSHAEKATQNVEEYPAVIIGGGVAALTAATYLARAGIEPLVITSSLIGGAINYTDSIQNWPGERDISSLDLVEKLFNQAQENGAIFCFDFVIEVDFSKRPFIIKTQNPYEEKFKTIKAETCIVATGSEFNTLGVPGEFEYLSHGVFSCAVCDGPLYKNKVVAVVGGGDNALKEANFLSNIAKKVYIVVRKDCFRTVEEKRKIEILSRPNVEVLYNTTIQSIEGDIETNFPTRKMTHLILKNKEEKETTLALDALFLAIGSTPMTSLFQHQLELTEKGHIVLKNFQETSIPDVFAAGDAADSRFKQAITAAGDGAKAAMQAQENLTHTVRKSQPKVATKLSSQTPITEIHSTSELTDALKKHKGISFVYFTAAHCPPCRTFRLIYDSWARDFEGKIQFLKVKTDQDPAVAESYEIQGIPCLLIFDENQQLIRKSLGLKELSELNTHLKELKEVALIGPECFKEVSK